MSVPISDLAFGSRRVAMRRKSVKRASGLLVCVTGASMLAACCAYEAFGQAIGQAIVGGLVEDMVFVAIGDETVPDLKTDEFFEDHDGQRVCLRFRLHAISSAEIDRIEDPSTERSGTRVRVRRSDVERSEAQTDTILEYRQLLSKQSTLTEILDAWATSDPDHGIPQYSLLHFYSWEPQELSAKTEEQRLLLERLDSPPREGWHQDLGIRVQRLNPDEPREHAEPEVLRFVGDSAFADLDEFRDRVSYVRGSFPSAADLAHVHFSSNCTLGDLTTTLQALADVGVVDVLLVLLDEVPRAPK